MPKTAPAKTTKKPAGKRPAHRPKGSKNIPRDEVEVMISRCKRCGSTNRKEYSDRPNRLVANGIERSSGQPYSAVVWRRTQCTDCGQHRVDKSYEFEPKERP